VGSKTLLQQNPSVPNWLAPVDLCNGCKTVVVIGSFIALPLLSWLVIEMASNLCLCHSVIPKGFCREFFCGLSLILDGHEELVQSDRCQLCVCVSLTVCVSSCVHVDLILNILGGFSMGGALAFHFGYRFCTDLAGVFALSAFLNEKSSVYDVSGLSIYFSVSHFVC